MTYVGVHASPPCWRALRFLSNLIGILNLYHTHTTTLFLLLLFILLVIVNTLVRTFDSALCHPFVSLLITLT